jgi:hypothetical protein
MRRRGGAQSAWTSCLRATPPPSSPRPPISFGVAAVAVGIGITYLPVDRWIRGFLAIGALFLVSQRSRSPSACATTRSSRRRRCCT